MSQYVVVSCSEDGDVSLSTFQSEEDLNEYFEDDQEPHFIKPERGNCDLQQEAGYVVIKGQVITPKPKVKVKEWSFG